MADKGRTDLTDLTSYKPISDYGIIGNLRTVALVGLDGSIDWCCFPHMDRGSVFAALLDAESGGRFKVSVDGVETGWQQYVEDTNVLVTQFDTRGGHVTVTDLMPLWGNIHGRGGSDTLPEIHRIIECEGQDADLHVEWSPRFDYARASMRIEPLDDGWIATGGGFQMSLGGLAGHEAEVVDEGSGPTLRAHIPMKNGDRRILITRWDTEETACNVEHSMEMLQVTVEAWQKWSHREGVTHGMEWAREWLPLLLRSQLVLKLLTHTDTGAMAAAPTTSLPETIGGVRNWDYRYTWIRDASLTAQALISMGHDAEAIDLLHWMERVSAEHYDEDQEPQIMYGLHGESDLPERELEHLEGYRGSRPVLIGNEAAVQSQHEIYGELMLTAYELLRRGVELEPGILDFLSKVADHACRISGEPDHGIWEIRGEPQHYTYTKVMLWVALDRAIHLAGQYGLQGDVDRWRRTKESLREQVLEHGYDREMGSFVQAFGSQELDAANVRIPLLEFLPFDDERVQGTLDRTLEGLTTNGLVYRYRMDDGLPGEEGAFVICTFWLADALSLSGRGEEAREIFENVVSHASRLGLLSEQIDPHTGEFLGNFPQAFSHIGLIDSALYLAYAEGRETPDPAPVGTPGHRTAINR